MATDLRQFVEQLAQLYRGAAAHSADLETRPELEGHDMPEVQPGAPTAVVFSPHPDDECLTGGWALRLRREAGWRVVNVAVTLGSNPERRQERLEELKRACAFLGFDLTLPGGKGLEKIQLQTRRDQPDYWTYAVNVIGSLLQELQPQLVFLPHTADNHGTHIGTHALVRHALIRAKDSVRCFVAESEYWAPQEDPNLLVELPTETVVQLVQALSLHHGEIARNPYHLRMPGWLMDNVRRGGELLSGHGNTPPDMVYGILYHLRRWDGKTYHEPAEAPLFIDQAMEPDACLKQFAG
ncbi:MAG: LmbE family protein [Puniceicoccaceae bacterium 5H]|nr:MAG: LmbE family protein [Puniceicoccaceae bacterium 5H]